jgi:hypothetical protein
VYFTQLTTNRAEHKTNKKKKTPTALYISTEICVYNYGNSAMLASVQNSAFVASLHSLYSHTAFRGTTNLKPLCSGHLLELKTQRAVEASTLISSKHSLLKSQSFFNL